MSDHIDVNGTRLSCW